MHPKINDQGEGEGEGASSEDEGCSSITKVSVRRRSSKHSVTFDVVDHAPSSEPKQSVVSETQLDVATSDDHEEVPTSEPDKNFVTSEMTEQQVTSNGTEHSVTSKRRNSETSVISRHSQTSDGLEQNVTSNGEQSTSSDAADQTITIQVSRGGRSESNGQLLKSDEGQHLDVADKVVKKVPRDPARRSLTSASSKLSTVSRSSKRSETLSTSKRSVTFELSKNDVTSPTLRRMLKAAGKTGDLDAATLRRITRKLPVVSDTLPPQACLSMAALPSRPALTNHKKVAGRLFSKATEEVEQWTRYTHRNLCPLLGPRRFSDTTQGGLRAPLELVPDKDLGPHLHALEPRPQTHHPRCQRMRPIVPPVLAHARTDVYSISFKHSDGSSTCGSEQGCDPDSELRSDYYSVKRVTLRSRATSCPVDRSRPSMLLMGRRKCLHGRDLEGQNSYPEDTVPHVVDLNAARL